jgi:hypothetical protein
MAHGHQDRLARNVRPERYWTRRTDLAYRATGLLLAVTDWTTQATRTGGRTMAGVWRLGGAGI